MKNIKVLLISLLLIVLSLVFLLNKEPQKVGQYHYSKGCSVYNGYVTTFDREKGKYLKIVYYLIPLSNKEIENIMKKEKEEALEYLIRDSYIDVLVISEKIKTFEGFYNKYE